ncbi:NAD(P)-dependent oxidoreductase [Paenibacillus sp. FSL H7-0737]|uniref:NAD-dependent epimerase/dehydratase family protein n=1 Tax=Paenibacillus sp. FSL H7-0737 TaxID=1536775 RepID=UPI0004F7BDF2|nr:NAD(P)-dependent oxidoreductase [Paenibacillus sp. FSL H7-0737]AIQ23703.1 dTDP-glucose 4,6-dehydratase [Paenibacillus sp. FSL H7-0737]
MKIFVAGAAGVIGRLLLPKLLEAGHEVVGMTHKEENRAFIEKCGAQAVIADVFDREAIFASIHKAQPEVVIHQLTSLSQRNFSDNSRIRIEGTRNIVDASLAAGVEQIVAQSISWAYEAGDVPATEETPLDLKALEPRRRTIEGIYSLEKAVAEIPNHVILRYGMLYGQGTWYDTNGYMAEEIRQERMTATDAVVSFLHVEDAANAAVLALNWPSGPVNIVDDEPAKGLDWLSAYSDTIGAPAPNVQEGRAGWERGASNTKARMDYEWSPLYPSWRSGFARSLNVQSE